MQITENLDEKHVYSCGSHFAHYLQLHYITLGFYRDIFVAKRANYLPLKWYHNISAEQFQWEKLTLTINFIPEWNCNSLHFEAAAGHAWQDPDSVWS